MPIKEVLYNISYSNIRMYYEVLPTYTPKDKNGKTKTDSTNFKGFLSVLKGQGNGR